MDFVVDALDAISHQSGIAGRCYHLVDPQGYRVGDSAYGLQLHPELDYATFAEWASESSDEALQRSGVSAQQANAAMLAAEPDLIRAWRPMSHAWADLVRRRANA